MIETLAYRLVEERHARLHRNGKPVRCTPSPEERWGVKPRRENKGTDGKVIYDSREHAEAAALEYEQLGLPPQRAYLCRRSRSGHHHLATVRKHPGNADVSRSLPSSDAKQIPDRVNVSRGY